MADIFDKETRSRIMSRIKAKDTKPEVRVRKFLFSKGLRYRKNQKGLPGKPDLVFRKHNSVVFINGCFWHGHDGCSRFVLPKSRTEFWQDKIDTNRKRDMRNLQALSDMGWRVMVVWECEVSKKDEAFLNRLHECILSP